MTAGSGRTAWIKAATGCYWCGASMTKGDNLTMPTREHIVPKHLIRTSTMCMAMMAAGLVKQQFEVACQLCNSRRNDYAGWIPWSEFFLTQPKNFPKAQRKALFLRGRLAVA